MLHKLNKEQMLPCQLHLNKEVFMAQKIICRKGRKPMTVHLGEVSRKVIERVAEEHGVSKTMALEIIIQLFGDQHE